MSKLISVIVPVYNVERYLRECVDSIVNQTYKNLEIILVDDGSTDSSSDICEEYARTDSRIRVIHKENGGLSSARNMGLDNAHGEYVGFVDSDDYIACDMYEKLIKACKTNNSSIAICHAIVFNDGHKPIINRGYIKKDYCTEDKKIIFSNALVMSQSVCNKLFRKELFNEIRFPYERVTEDGYIIYDVLYRARRVSYVALGGYFYRRRDDSITTRKYVERDADFVICNVRSYYRIKNKFPELWEEGLCRAVNSGFLPVLKKIMLLDIWELVKVYTSLKSISRVLGYLQMDLQQTNRISDDVKEYIWLFIKSPILLYRELKKSNIEIGSEKNSRAKLYDDLMTQWNINKTNNIHIIDSLRENDLKKIAIYGIGTLGELLYNEIKNTDVKISCFIDQSAENYVYGFDDVMVITPDVIHNIGMVDAIIVTPIHVYESIEKTIRNNGFNGKVISLERLINFES